MAASASGVFDSLIRDFRYGIRTLARTPGFSVIAIVVMALGIGASAALFTVVHSVLLKPLPLPDVDRLVAIYEADTKLKFNNNVVAGGTFHSWEQENRTFQHIAISTEDRRQFLLERRPASRTNPRRRIFLGCASTARRPARIRPALHARRR